MNHGHTIESLTAFRDRVADAFKAKKILAPVHFPGGEERHILAALADIQPHDWLCVGWRSMYAALLKGCDPEWVFNEIICGRSMYLMSKQYRVIGSSIVGGILPIACGLAMGIKRRGGPERVYCVVGDMTATTGLFREFAQYCGGHKLPVRVVVFDNNRSTNANTAQTWGAKTPWRVWSYGTEAYIDMRHYEYERTMPHVGCAERVSF